MGLEWVALAESHFGLRFVRVTNTEYRSLDGCPWCNDGGRSGDGDRFRLFTVGRSGPRVWCRQCGNYMFLNTLDEHRKLSDEEITRLNLELQARREEEKQKQQDALAKIMTVEDHIEYHRNLGVRPDAVDYWKSQGLTDKSISRHILGWCPACPTAPYSPSYTMPVLYHGKLYNIRHRLAEPNGGGKYRPHMAGLPVMLFNADNLDEQSEYGLLLEGEKKSMVVSQETGLLSVGIMGMASFAKSWVEKFANWKYVYVILDPDADERAEHIARLFDGRGVVVTLPVKADDFFFKHGGTRGDFIRYMNMGRLVK